MSFLVDSNVRTRMQSSGVSPDSEVELYIRVLNAILEGRKETMADLCVGIHLCRGNLTVSLSQSLPKHVADPLYMILFRFVGREVLCFGILRTFGGHVIYKARRRHILCELAHFPLTGFLICCDRLILQSNAA